MKRAAVKYLMGVLGIHDSYENNEWQNSHCPFGFLHGKGIDEHPSFGISVSEDRQSIYHCFGCMSRAYPLSHLAFRLWTHKHPRWRDVAEIVATEEVNSVEAPDIPILIDKWQIRPEQPKRVLPKKVVDTFPLLCVDRSRTARLARRYLEGRGISEKTWKRFGVRTWDYRETLIFPFTDQCNEIQVLRVRSVHQKSMFTISHNLLGYTDPFPTFKTSGALFSYKLDWDKPVMLCEAEIDAMRAYELGYKNVIAVGGSTLVPKQAERILARTVLLGFDADQGGDKATRCAMKRLEGKASLIYIDWKKVKCKDPGELPNRKALDRALKSAHII